MITFGEGWPPRVEWKEVKFPERGTKSSLLARVDRFLFSFCTLLRRGRWGAFESSDGWIKVLRGNRPPGEQWPRVQKHTTVASPELKGRWRNGAPNTPKFPSKLQSLEDALSSLGGARSGVDTCEGAIKTQASSVQQSRCGQRGSKVEGHQVGESFGSYGGFFRSRGRLFAEGPRKGPRGSTGTPLGGPNQRMPRIYKQGRASRPRSWRQTSWPRRTCWRKGEQD